MSLGQDAKLESIEAANYLIQELLAQIDTLKQENEQVRNGNDVWIYDRFAGYPFVLFRITTFLHSEM